MDYSKFISEQSKARKTGPIRWLMPYMNNKEFISLGAGQPNPELFPFKGLTVTLTNDEKLEIDAALLRRSLSYDLTSGQPGLSAWLRKLQILEHNPPVEFDLTIGAGSQDLLTKALDMFINPGSAILVEDPTFPGALTFLDSLDCDLVSVATDCEGIIPEALDAILANWPETNPSDKPEQPRPQVLYTIPCGGNPTGASSPKERKEAVYAICQKYNIMILEDDPYYFLQFNNQRIKSYLSMDVDGRVLRCDSMSKILSSGLRVGWATGPKELIERLNMHTMATNLQPPGVPQAMAFTVLDHWGYDQFFDHVASVAHFYKTKRDEIIECLETQMKGIAEWNVPHAGMFVWLKILGVKDSENLVMNNMLKKKVLAIPGVAFMPNGNKNPYIRISFSNISKDQMTEALIRVRDAVADASVLTNGNGKIYVPAP